MNDLSRDDIRHLSQLARLELTDEEYTQYATQLSGVVEYIAQLQEVDTSKVEVKLGVSGLLNVIAEDVVREANDPASIDVLAVLKAAPRLSGRGIEVRAALSGDVEVS